MCSARTCTTPVFNSAKTVSLQQLMCMYVYVPGCRERRLQIKCNIIIQTKLVHHLWVLKQVEPSTRARTLQWKSRGYMFRYKKQASVCISIYVCIYLYTKPLRLVLQSEKITIAITDEQVSCVLDVNKPSQAASEAECNVYTEHIMLSTETLCHDDASGIPVSEKIRDKMWVRLVFIYLFLNEASRVSEYWPIQGPSQGHIESSSKHQVLKIPKLKIWISMLLFVFLVLWDSAGMVVQTAAAVSTQQPTAMFSLLND